MTTASAPSGIGAPVAIAAHVPVSIGLVGVMPEKIVSTTRSSMPWSRAAPAVSVARTA